MPVAAQTNPTNNSNPATNTPANSDSLAFARVPALRGSVAYSAAQGAALLGPFVSLYALRPGEALQGSGCYAVPLTIPDAKAQLLESLGKAGWTLYFDQGNRVGFSQGNAVVWLEFSLAGEGWSFLSFARWEIR